MVQGCSPTPDLVPASNSPTPSIERGSPIGIHVSGLTVGMLADASRAARTVDRAVALIDDAAHVVVLVDESGRIVVRPGQPQPASR
jgi:hypothetical protein